MIKATQLTEKSWILIKGKGNRCGLMRQQGEGYAILGGPFPGTYDSVDALQEVAGEKIKFVEAKKKEEKEEVMLGDFPVKHTEVFDVTDDGGYYTYTKKEGSTDIYAAGYWCINFNGKWHGHFCPRNKTLMDNDHIGPLKTKIEMDHTLKIENGK